MSSRPRDDGEDISLFPFLSVLACVIGTLTMIIAAIAVQALDNDTVEAALEYQSKQAELDERHQELQQLRNQLKQRQSEQSEEYQRVEELKKRLAALLAQLEETQGKLQTISIEGPKVDVAAQTEEVAQMEAELQSRREEIAQLEAQIAERNLPPEESQVSILPGGSGVGFAPWFVECDDGRIVIHDGDKTTPVRTAELNTNPDFAKVLEEVKAHDNGTLVFLIRDDGLGTYHAARNFANSKGVRNGKLPVIGDGRIDLSYFKKQAQSS